MNFHTLDPWTPYHVIEVGDQKFEIFSRIVVEDDFVMRTRFMLVFPDGKKRMLSIASSKHAAEDHNAHSGAGSYEKLIRETVIEAAMEEIKANVKVFLHSNLQSDVKLVPLDMENPIHVGFDFAEAESQMMAQVFNLPPLKGGPIHIHGPSYVAFAQKVNASKKVMEDAFKKLASTFVKAAPTWDSLAGASKAEIFKVLYGGEPTKKLTPTGLATLKRFGVALAG
jgi:hypothetical protein